MYADRCNSLNQRLTVLTFYNVKKNPYLDVPEYRNIPRNPNMRNLWRQFCYS